MQSVYLTKYELQRDPLRTTRRRPNGEQRDGSASSRPGCGQERCRSPTERQSFAPLALGLARLGFPSLTPWATVFRRSAAGVHAVAFLGLRLPGTLSRRSAEETRRYGDGATDRRPARLHPRAAGPYCHGRHPTYTAPTIRALPCPGQLGPLQEPGRSSARTAHAWSLGSKLSVHVPPDRVA